MFALESKLLLQLLQAFHLLLTNEQILGCLFAFVERVSVVDEWALAFCHMHSHLESFRVTGGVVLKQVHHGRWYSTWWGLEEHSDLRRRSTTRSSGTRISFCTPNSRHRE